MGALKEAHQRIREGHGAAYAKETSTLREQAEQQVKKVRDAAMNSGTPAKAREAHTSAVERLEAAKTKLAKAKERMSAAKGENEDKKKGSDKDSDKESDKGSASSKGSDKGKRKKSAKAKDGKDGKKQKGDDDKSSGSGYSAEYSGYSEDGSDKN